ncbi:hypothetical protein ACFX11_040000 [Malus domestica]
MEKIIMCFFFPYFWLFLKEESGGEWSGAKLANAAGRTARPISQYSWQTRSKKGKQCRNSEAVSLGD